ncbi:MAG: molybdopterin-dependent oxidoreductase [Methanophagales archaeon]|nr:molybdopterin-dependent oxidoreductase [Methanophagales archaeon]
MKEDRKTIGFVVIIAVICIGAIAAVMYTHPFGAPEEKINWNLTLIGTAEKVVTFDELKAMPSYEGYGGFFSTVGMINGPFKCKGVPVEDLCALVGGISGSDTLWVSAQDGYMMVFTYDQCKGSFVTFDTTTLREVPHGELKTILMYEQDGAPLSEDNGRPLRIAIVSEDKLLTEGHYWIKWVDKIEIRTIKDHNNG